MKDRRQFYIEGKWINPAKSHDFAVINPATEVPIATISLGTSADVKQGGSRGEASL
jgi:aldehyde dehydrogenase (NAD+)